MSQLDFFDYITGITIGSSAAELATELENPERPLVAMLVYGICSVGLSTLAAKLPKTRKFINGSPTILMDGGKLYRDNIKKAKIELSEFLVLCREQGYFNLQDIQTATFEHNGTLTILPVASARPLTPADMKVTVQPASIWVELIMDGRILHENLKRMGLDKAWLDQQLRAAGYRQADDVFLAVCDQNKSISWYPYHEK